MARRRSTRARWTKLLLVASACLLATAARAQGADADSAVFKPALTYDGSVLGVVHGGARRGVGYIGNLHLRLSLDAPSGSRLDGTSAYLDVLSIHGGAPGDRVGDAQGTSNIEGPRGTGCSTTCARQRCRCWRASTI